MNFSAARRFRVIKLELIMQTLNEFKLQHPDKYFWTCDAGSPLVDVLVYDTQADLDSDNDNTLAIARATVIGDEYLTRDEIEAALNTQFIQLKGANKQTAERLIFGQFDICAGFKIEPKSSNLQFAREMQNYFMRGF